MPARTTTTLVVMAVEALISWEKIISFFNFFKLKIYTHPNFQRPLNSSGDIS